MRNHRLLYTVFCVLFLYTASAQIIPLDTAVHTGVLPNGFTYYIRHNEEPKNRVFLYLVNNVGSVLEDSNQQGLAHFMEHMNFNGTTHFPKNELINYLQKSGVRFGADLNAYTDFDETVYQLPLPADDPSILQNGFQIMRDWAQNATLDSIEIDKERGVVLEEERLGRGASERMERVYLPVLLNQSRYSERNPIGKVDILTNFPPSAIRKFHADWYRPDLQALVVVGDIDPVKTEALVKQLFSDLKTPAGERTRTQYTVPLTGQNHFLRVTDKEMPQTVLQVMIKHPEEKLITEENYIHSMQRALFNEMIAERFAELAQKPGLPYLEAGASISGFFGRIDAFSLEVALKQGKFKEGFQTAWELVETVKRFGFTQSELDRAQKNYVSFLETAFKEKSKTNSESLVGEYQRLYLNQEASPGITWEFDFAKSHIDQITLDQINGIVKDYIREQDRDILILAPEKDKGVLPDSATVMSWMNEVNQKKLTAVADEINKQPLLAVTPLSGKVIEKKTIPSIGASILTLSNGVRVILKPTDFKNDEIRFAAFSPGGTSLYSDANYVNASNAGLIAGFGVGNFNPVQLDKMLAGRIFEVTPYIGERTQGIQGYSTPKDFETALQLLYLRFTRPRKDSDLYNNIINSTRDQLANRYSDPTVVFNDTVSRILGNYNYRRQPFSVERLNQLNLDKLYRIYRERFSDASGFIFVFVGNFNTDSIRPLLERYLGSLPSLHKKESARDLGIHIPGGQLTKKVFKGSENKATVKMVIGGDYVYSAENNMVMQALKEVLEIKTTQHLREDESEVYSPSIQVAYSKYPHPRYSFNISFGCAPANADHLIKDVLKEMDTLRKNGPTQEDLDKFKAEYKRVHEVQITDNQSWLNYLLSQYENQEDPNQILNYNQRVDSVTRAMVQKAAQTYLSGVNDLRFVLLPEKTTK
jgi:zinc protease